MPRCRRAPRGLTMIELMIVMFVILILAALIAYNVNRAQLRGQYGGCVSNLKNMGTALNLYANDNAMRYPTTIVGVTPTYLKAVPTCPAAGYTTYLTGFASSSNPDAYTLICAGSNHVQVGKAPNFPQFVSGTGLIEY